MSEDITVIDKCNEDEELYRLARKLFAKKDFVSTASLQRHLQIPYFTARHMLDLLISDNFCEEQIGSFPCRILHFTN